MEIVERDWEKTWSKVVADYDIGKREKDVESVHFASILSKYVKKGSFLIEAGCGYGLRCLYFNRHNDASCVGIDIVLEPLKQLNLYLKTSKNNTQLSGGDVTHIPFSDCTFDVISSFGVVEHFRLESQVSDFLNDATMVLKERHSNNYNTKLCVHL